MNEQEVDIGMGVYILERITLEAFMSYTACSTVFTLKALKHYFANIIVILSVEVSGTNSTYKKSTKKVSLPKEWISSQGSIHPVSRLASISQPPTRSQALC